MLQENPYTTFSHSLGLKPPFHEVACPGADTDLRPLTIVKAPAHKRLA
jgi:hypothetical protein